MAPKKKRKAAKPKITHVIGCRKPEPCTLGCRCDCHYLRST